MCTQFTKRYVLDTTIYVIDSHHTANAAVSFHDALAVDVTGVGLTIGAKPGAMAASDLVTCEASLTFSTAEGALVWTVETQKPVFGYRN